MQSGDGNNDGKFDYEDIGLLIKYCAKKVNEDNLTLSNLDANSDGNVNIIDLTYFLHAFCGEPTIDISMVSDIEVAGLTDTDLEKFKTAYNKCVYEDGTMEDAQSAYAYYRAIIDKYDMKNFKITDENVDRVFGDLIYSYFDMLASQDYLEVSEEIYYYDQEKDEVYESEQYFNEYSWFDKITEPNVTSIETFRNFLTESYSLEIADYIIDYLLYDYSLVEKNGALYISWREAGWFDPIFYETMELIEEKNGVYKISFLESGSPAGDLYNYCTFDIQKINGKYKIINIEKLFEDDFDKDYYKLPYFDDNLEKVTITGDLHARPSKDSKSLFSVNQETFDLFYIHKINGETWYLVEGFAVKDYENYGEYDKYYGEGASEWIEDGYENHCYGWYKKQ
jgi:hypothetical protein